jgi:WhiB family redox-sensing transcriptional regulator
VETQDRRGWDKWRIYGGFRYRSPRAGSGSCAACRNLDSALFFQPEGERGPAKAAREAGAKQICRHCPVLEQCRRHALAVGEPYGVWGGMSMAERSALLRGVPDTHHLD